MSSVVVSEEPDYLPSGGFGVSNAFGIVVVSTIGISKLTANGYLNENSVVSMVQLAHR